MLLSNALLLHLAVLWSGKRLFRASYSALHSHQARVASRRVPWIDRVAYRFMGMTSHDMRLLIIKDLRLFRRDPVQWSQFLIFFGLLLLYFANVDRFRQHRSDVTVLAWVNIVSFLNLAVVGLILSTFTTRFIYPLISLEGRRFWILGRLPVQARYDPLGQVSVCRVWFLVTLRGTGSGQRYHAGRELDGGGRTSGGLFSVVYRFCREWRSVWGR